MQPAGFRADKVPASPQNVPTAFLGRFARYSNGYPHSEKSTVFGFRSRNEAKDMIAGHVQMMFATASSVVPHIRDGKVRPLGVATLKRTAVLPDIPTIDERGIKNFDATTWHGLVAPAHTPKDVIATLNRALAAALDDPEVKKS